MYEAIMDVADQKVLPSVCGWEGCLGGPSSPWARPAAFLLGGLESVDRQTYRRPIPIGRR